MPELMNPFRDPTKARDLRTDVVHHVDNEDAMNMWGTTFCGIPCTLRDWRGTSKRVTCLRCIALESA